MFFLAINAPDGVGKCLQARLFDFFTAVAAEVVNGGGILKARKMRPERILAEKFVVLLRKIDLVQINRPLSMPLLPYFDSW